MGDNGRRDFIARWLPLCTYAGPAANSYTELYPQKLRVEVRYRTSPHGGRRWDRWTGRNRRNHRRSPDLGQRRSRQRREPTGTEPRRVAREERRDNHVAHPIEGDQRRDVRQRRRGRPRRPRVRLPERHADPLRQHADGHRQRLHDHGVRRTAPERTRRTVGDHEHLRDARRGHRTVHDRLPADRRERVRGRVHPFAPGSLEPRRRLRREHRQLQ